MKKTKKSNFKEGIALGAGIAALSVAAYVLFGPEGKKNRKTVRGWSVKMKGEIIEKLEEAKEITEPMYHDILNKVSEKYAGLKNIDQEELKTVVGDLRKPWKHVLKEIKPKKKSLSKSKKLKK